MTTTVGKTETPPKLESINNLLRITTAQCASRELTHKKMQWGGGAHFWRDNLDSYLARTRVGSQAVDPTLTYNKALGTKTR